MSVFLQFGETGVAALAPLLMGLRFDLPWIYICIERESDLGFWRERERYSNGDLDFERVGL